jgi:hypothetical protein
MGLIKPELINLAQHRKPNPVLLKAFFAENPVGKGFLGFFLANINNCKSLWYLFLVVTAFGLR